MKEDNTRTEHFYKERALLFTSLAHFANDGNFLLFSILIIYFSRIPDISIVFLGVTAIIYNVIYGAVSLPIGRIADAIDKDAFLIALGIALEGASAALFGLVFLFPSSYILLILLGALSLGAGQAFYHPLGASILSFTYKNEKLGTALGINGSIGSVGRALLPSVITFLLLGFGMTDGLEYLAVYVWVLAIAIYFGLRRFRRVYTKPKSMKKKKKTPMSVKRKLYRVVFPIFLKGAFLMGTVTFIAKYLYYVTGSAESTGLILTASFIPAIIGQPFFGYLTAKKGGRYIISLTSILSFFAFSLFLLTKNIIILTAAYALLAFFMFNGFSVLLDYTYQLVSEDYYSTAYSFVWGVGNILGGAAGIGLMTFFLTFANIATSMVYMLAVLFLSIMVLPLLPKETKRKTA